MYIIAVGDLMRGFDYVGPFQDEDEADNFINSALEVEPDDLYQLMELTLPRDFMEKIADFASSDAPHDTEEPDEDDDEDE